MERHAHRTLREQLEHCERLGTDREYALKFCHDGVAAKCEVCDQLLISGVVAWCRQCVDARHRTAVVERDTALALLDEASLTIKSALMALRLCASGRRLVEFDPYIAESLLARIRAARGGG